MGTLTSEAPGWLRSRAPSILTFAMSFALVSASLASLPHLGTSLPIVDSHRLPWWAFAAGFFAAEFLVFHLEIGREAHTFTFSEAPFAIGLIFADPLTLLVGRIVGECLFLLSFGRTRPLKILFNVSIYVAETTVALWVFTRIGATDVDGPRTWLAVVAAIIAADLVSLLAVSRVIAWHGGGSRPRLVLLAGIYTGLTNATLALVGVILLRTNPWALTLLSALVISMWVAYRSFAALAQRFERLQLFQEFARAIAATTTVDAVLERVLDQARQLVRGDYARIEIMSVGGSGAPAAWELSRQRALRADDPILHDFDLSSIRGARKRGSSRGDRGVLEHLGLREFVVAPLHEGDHVIGYLLVGDRVGETGGFDSNDTRLLEVLANHASVALENGNLIARLQQSVQAIAHQASHDSLTGLPNRAGFADLVTTWLESRGIDEYVALLLIDLDRFKEINDTLGHYAGDQLLEEVARRLLRIAIEGVEVGVARLGGDEFAVVMRGLESPHDAIDLTRRVREQLVEAAWLGSFQIDVGASIGIAVAPNHGEDIVTLLQRADVAMYEAKAHHTGIEIYEARSDSHSVSRLTLANSLRTAISRGDLEVHFQPKASLATGMIVGVEALVRWNHAELGMIPPAEFVEMAEQSGSILDLTDFVLDRSLEQCAAWRQLGYNLTMAVNVSAANLVDGGFARRVENHLVHRRLSPDRLVLEITESAMLELDQVLAILRRISDRGVSLSVDDFGTGYSSLAYLQNLPVHEVKIDRSFVTPMAAADSDLGIVRAIIDLAHTLGLRVVAEGVEDLFTWDRLVALQCDQVQGYYLSRPLAADRITTWLGERRTAPIVAPRGAQTLRSAGGGRR